MISIVFVTSVNYNIQIKDITFIKNYIKQLIELIYKVTMNELFNAAHSKIQTYQFTSRFTAVFDSKLIF